MPTMMLFDKNGRSANHACSSRKPCTCDRCVGQAKMRFIRSAHAAGIENVQYHSRKGFQLTRQQKRMMEIERYDRQYKVKMMRRRLDLIQ